MVLIYSPDYDQHHDPLHIENNGRTHAILDALVEKKYLENIKVLEPEKASENDILRVHTSEHVDYIREFCSSGGGILTMIPTPPRPVMKWPFWLPAEL